MHRIRIKICGMTRPQDVEDAVGLGVDAIGMILHADSPRTISVEQAKEIRKVVPAFVSLVGVFVNADKELVKQYHKDIQLDLIQFHGEESRAYVSDINLSYIKAIRARDAAYINQQITEFSDARALLLDPYVKGQHGGTGKQLDQSLWPQETAQKLILAGGLSGANVEQAVGELQPYAVDFNSGVESQPGEKDYQRMKQAVSVLRR